ncbi:gluconate 2-dehydrogenase subunit 3 family protein, partial [Brevibacterium sp. SIMBA_078]|uniref:gluconate 2-dehydrogenase subunit 3 family protein n=1 Tax=Brevibacterium sp. SIMBA_078 TaxID=3085816 RepID=UPI00397E8449
AKGYGQDPNLVMPPESPWPLTLTKDEITLVALLADYIVPREGDIPSASELQVPAVINEWVSAPYEGQQRDRIKILNSLAWINDES